jgi:hypothetical protein
MSGLYWAMNAAFPTTAAPVKMTTGTTTVKTLLQVATPSTQSLRVVEWGISFDGSAAATPIECELVDTGAVGATSLTSLTPELYSPDTQEASLCVGGTSATGFNSGSSTEGSTTVTRYADLQLIAPTSQWVKQWPLGREFYVPASHFLRVRVTAATAVNAYCYVIWQE